MLVLSFLLFSCVEFEGKFAMDDDGDGTPDVLEGVETNDADVNVNALMVIMAIFVVVILLFIARLRRGGPGDLTALDQQHL